MPTPPLLHDLACVIHLHSTYSDGTGTVPEIAAAARRNALDAVLLTDHDTLEARHRGEEGWHGSVLVLVGEEVTPPHGDHLLAFGLDEEVERADMTAAEVCEAVRDAGGFGFAAHPFSRGSRLFKKRVAGMPFEALDCEALGGIELWSFLNDTLEPVDSFRELARFIAHPERVVEHVPARNLRAWEALCRARRVTGIAGLDAHQVGVRVAGRVLRLMGYARSFRNLRTHVLCEELPSGELTHDRAQVYEALREGRCYLAQDVLAPARGFCFWAEGPGGTLPMGAEDAAGAWTLNASAPRPAELRIVRDGELLARRRGARIEHRAEAPGVYRCEARLHAYGSERTWVVSNPIYLR